MSHGSYDAVTRLLTLCKSEHLLARFQEEYIDDEVVHLITEEHLKYDLAISQLGIRLRILKALGKFPNSTSARDDND